KGRRTAITNKQSAAVAAERNGSVGARRLTTVKMVATIATAITILTATVERRPTRDWLKR
ncbi:MAG: hypothetical protein IJE77_07020, partial [Thermoguttaceae bacterium]|nr:hypothetical protein [Thermoguttaceae bacterium]